MYVKGVGPARAAMLEAKGLRVVEDLLTYAPFRYEDRPNVKPIRDLAPGEMATVLAEVRSAKVSGMPRRGAGIFQVRFGDSTGGLLTGKWFHCAFLSGILAPRHRLPLLGQIALDNLTWPL